MGKILSDEEHQKQLEEQILKNKKELEILKKELEVLYQEREQEHEEQCQAIEKVFKYVDEYPLKNQSHFEKKMSKIREDVNNGKNLRDVTDWDFLWLHLLKISNDTSDSQKRWDIYLCYEKASQILGGFNSEVSSLFYELWVLIKREETSLGAGLRSEKQIFKNATDIIKYYIPTFTDGVFEKVVQKKRIDLLGKCTKTKKYIIVEFKKGCRDTTNQLYSYDRLLGGGNILVSLTETEPPIKHNGIIYLNLEKYKEDIKNLKR